MRTLLLPLTLALACNGAVKDTDDGTGGNLDTADVDTDTDADTDTDTDTDTGPTDADGDGFSADEDCDDGDATVNPDAQEVWYDGVDQNCDGLDDDQDGDGYALAEDCDDTDASAYPGADEVWYDGVDGDCDARSDYDADGDGYDSDSFGGTDCDDTEAGTSPGDFEVPNNGLDDDCDGTTDEGLSTEDADGDGFAEADGDCDDGDATVNPDAAETWYDGLDQDCDGWSDYDADADGYDSDLYGGDDCDDTSADVSPTDVEDPTNGMDDDCDGTVDEALSTDDLDGDGFSEADGDCDDADAAVNPAATETWYDGVDQDCDGASDFDQDADGYVLDDDCDDTDATVSPAATDTWYDGVDTNCDGADDYDADGDGEQSTTYGGTDCEDSDATIYAAAAEVCDGLDQDCDTIADDGVTSLYYADGDSDGYGDPALDTEGCSAPSGYVANNDDCDDSTATVSPAASETCNGIDDDCDGTTDEDVTTTYYADDDNDGYGDPASTVAACSAPSGYVTDATDCNDSASTANPGATEVCDTIDNDCDGSIDEGVTSTYYRDSDGDGYGDITTTTASCSAPAGYVGNSSDCNDGNASVSPSASESCNGTDDDCDGVTDEGVTTLYYLDADADGYGVSTTTTAACSLPSGYSTVSSDCNDANAAVSPGDVETCNSIDDDCDGSTDEGVTTTYYQDNDGDGYGSTTSTAACSAPSGYVVTAGDCNDASAAVSPADPEVCNSIDDDCDGTTDEGLTTTYYPDADGDGYGDAAAAIDSCTTLSGYTTTGGDCDDGDATAFPGAAEVSYDVADNDCDGYQDDMNVADEYTWSIVGELSSDGIGGCWMAEDFDDDGAPDIEVGGPTWDAFSSASSDYGVFAFHDVDDLDTPADVTSGELEYWGNSSDDKLGNDFAVLSDFDGDGNLTVAVAAYEANVDGSDDGIVYLLEPADAWASYYASSWADGAVYGIDSSSNLGYSVAAGDFDGDGEQDLAMGAPGDSSAAGRVYVALENDDAWQDAIDATDVTYYVRGVSSSDHLGYSVVFGDFDDDGYDDLVACSPDDDDNGSASGTCWIDEGSASRSVSGSTISSVDEAVITGAAASDQVGLYPQSLSVGDFDGDGRDDLAVGVPGYDGGTSGGGAVAIWDGGDLSGSESLTNATWLVTGDGALGTSVSLDGDITGDGTVDLLAGAPTVSTNTGRVYLLAGGQSPGTYALPSDQYASWLGESTSDSFGWWVAGVADLDQDGRDDFCASATGDDDGATNGGKVYVVPAYP
ncbi:MAG: MopE-related protein [Myxococcota bacterium]